MDVFEIAIRELIPSFGMLVLLFVDPQIPFPVFIEPVQADKLILFVCGGLVFAPRIPSVQDNMPFADEFFSVVKRSFVEDHRHGFLPPSFEPSARNRFGVPATTDRVKMTRGCVPLGRHAARGLSSPA